MCTGVLLLYSSRMVKKRRGKGEARGGRDREIPLVLQDVVDLISEEIRAA